MKRDYSCHDSYSYAWAKSEACDYVTFLSNGKWFQSSVLNGEQHTERLAYLLAPVVRVYGVFVAFKLLLLSCLYIYRVLR